MRKILFAGLVLVLSIPSLTLASTYSSAQVVYKDSNCTSDYYLIYDNSGYYDLLEWYGGITPNVGDIMYGNFHTYLFKNFYDTTYRSTTRAWEEDMMISTADEALSEYYTHCDY